ncbi:MAG: hypothetical protein M3137_07720 [Actinomycetota bacterium]|nr:hypothetical protein [Actinomycetota bacterium]
MSETVAMNVNPSMLPGRSTAPTPTTRVDISALKVMVPEGPTTRVVDRAIQVRGAAGVSNDLPLAEMYQGARTLRLADGPDEIHKILVAKNVLGRYDQGESWDFAN